jgi:hypothetical protein
MEKTVRRCEICDRQLVSEKEYHKCFSCYEKYQNTIALVKSIRSADGKNNITEEQINLYLALVAKNWEVDLEYKDYYDPKDSSKYKTVDIAILSAKLYIEINGMQHVRDYQQLRSDLWRSYFSFDAGFLTLSVFNDAIKSRDEFHQIVNVINDIARRRKDSINQICYDPDGVPYSRDFE